jgi:rhamnose transport system permease protein
MIRRILLTREAALFLALVALFTAFSIVTPNFFDLLNLLDRSRHWVVVGMVAVPMTFVIASAGIDLSVGSIVALCSMCMGLLWRDAEWPIAVAATAAIAIGLMAGAANGAVSSYLRIPPLVVTLATMALYSGIAMGLSKGGPVRSLPDSLQWISQGDSFMLRGGVPPAYFPVPLFALIALFIFGGVLMRKTWFGRFTEAIGENEIAAQFAAIDVRRIKLAIYAFSGLVAGIAALFYSALFASARPEAGRGLELEAIACVVIGGTRISGGSGSIVGALLGLLIIGILRYGLELSGVRSDQLIIVVGALLIVMAVFNEWMASKAGGKV